MTQAICRSALYMPANNARAMQKAVTLPADAIIIDLEDSVAPNAKVEARMAAVEALTANDYRHRLKVLRVNALDTPWFSDDMQAASKAKPDAVLLPKVETASMVIEAQEMLDKLATSSSSCSIKIWAMMETPKAIVNAASIAASAAQCARLDTFCIGNNDLARAANMKITSDRTLLIPWLMQLVAVAKTFNLNILDGVYNDFADLDGFALECVQGAAMGMDGKTLIHPKQIESANAAFAPSATDIKDAQLIVDTFAMDENSKAGVVQINGRMIERLHLEMAQHTLDIARRINELH